MGGRGSGGARVGAGRRPKTVLQHWIGGDAGKRGQAPVGAPQMPREAVTLPEGVPNDVRLVWERLAPHAIKAGTLVPTTADAFRRLCQAVVLHAKMQAEVDRDGFTYLKVTVDGAGQEHKEIKAHPLIARAAALDTQIRGMLKDFGINPVGKPLAEATPKPVNAFAKFGATG